MKWFLVFAMGLCVFPRSLRADDAVLLQRIVELEERLAGLEKKLAPVLEEERIKGVVLAQQAFAKERMLMDGDFYPREILRGIERTYQRAVQDWGSDACKAGLTELVKKFPRSNRAGCAALNLGQMLEGDEQLEYLEKAMTVFGGCYYDDGVQVGPYAMLYLGMRHKRDGADAKAKKLFAELKSRYPDAVDHKGRLLSESYKGME